MSNVVRILGFATLACGCVVGRYRDVASTREVVYVEEKGASCDQHGHRRNHTLQAAAHPARLARPVSGLASRAS